MTEEQIDHEVLEAVSSLVIVDERVARLLQRMWSDRARLLNLVDDIRIWDMTHSEALTVEKVQKMINETFDELGVRR